MNYDDTSEMNEVLGSIKSNGFINELEEETSMYLEIITSLIN
jgi:hypothetical protein